MRERMKIGGSRAGWRMLGVALVLVTTGCMGRGSTEEGEDEGAERVVGTDRVELGTEVLADIGLTYGVAEMRELAPALEVPAEIMPDPDRIAMIGSRVSGRIVDVRANVGDQVQAGQPLVVLESVEVGTAVADYGAAVARAAVARSAAERAARLYEDRIVAERRMEEARAALQMAEADETAAATRLRAYGLAVPPGPGSERGRVTLRSPIDGSVTSRTASLGQWVEPAETLAEVMNLEELWVLGSVYERDHRHVEAGQPVQVDVRAYPGEVFPGAVDLVETTLDETSRSATIRVVLPNPERRLKPGMFATARITGTRAHEPEQLLAIPTAAVQELDGRTSVFVPAGEGVFVLRRVYLGEQGGEYVEVLSGLVPGDEVVVDGSFVLKAQLLRSTLGEEEES